MPKKVFLKIRDVLQENNTGRPVPPQEPRSKIVPIRSAFKPSPRKLLLLPSLSRPSIKPLDRRSVPPLRSEEEPCLPYELDDKSRSFARKVGYLKGVASKKQVLSPPKRLSVSLGRAIPPPALMENQSPLMSARNRKIQQISKQFTVSREALGEKRREANSEPPPVKAARTVEQRMSGDQGSVPYQQWMLGLEQVTQVKAPASKANPMLHSRKRLHLRPV